MCNSLILGAGTVYDKEAILQRTRSERIRWCFLCAPRQRPSARCSESSRPYRFSVGGLNMSHATSHEPRGMPLRVLGPDLPLLACQAAIELDNYILGKSSELNAVNRLGRVLRDSIGTAEGATLEETFLDPSTVAVMTRALDASRWSKDLRTIKELIQEAAHIANNLESPSTDSAKHVLEKMREFCATLSICASSYLQSIQETRAPHPYRR